MNILMNKKPKLMELPITSFPTTQEVIDLKLNVREPENYDQVSMQDSLAEYGQKEPGIATPFIMPNGDSKYRVLRGNLRLHNIRRNAERNIVDPRTRKEELVTQPDGTKSKEMRGGKVFSTITMWVYEDLTADEEAQLIDDQGEQTPLNMAETFNSVVLLWDQLGDTMKPGQKEEQIAVRLRKLLDRNFQLPAAVLKKHNNFEGPTGLKDYKNARRGLIQNFMKVLKCPPCVKDAFIRKLKGDQAWPTNPMVMDLLKAYEADRTDPISTPYTRENPGPTFTKLWDEIVTEHKAAAEEGRVARKFNALGSGETADFIKNSDSKLAIGWFLVQRRELVGQPVTDLRDFCVALENAFTPEQKAKLGEILKKSTFNKTPTAEAVVARIESEVPRASEPVGELASV